MKKKKNGLFITGIVGTVLTLLCCATPILIILFGAVGIGALTGYIDYILIPALIVFAGIAYYAYDKSSKDKESRSLSCDCSDPASSEKK
jgi:mercuric ion transport protein